MPEQESNQPTAIVLHERIAKAEASLTVLSSDNLTTRDRVHSLSNDMQRLFGSVDGLTKMVERLATALDNRSGEIVSMGTDLKNHVTGCREENLEQRGDRQKFRSEMRRYMLLILLAIIGWVIAGKLHISFDGIAQ